MKNKYITSILLLLISTVISAFATIKPSKSFYTQKPDDPEAVFFIPEKYSFTNDGKTDVSVQLQNAINQLKAFPEKMAKLKISESEVKEAGEKINKVLIGMLLSSLLTHIK